MPFILCQIPGRFYAVFFQGTQFLAEEFRTLEAKARSSGMEDVSFHPRKMPGWHGSELMPAAKRANSKTSAVSLTLEVRHGRVRLLCSE